MFKLSIFHLTFLCFALAALVLASPVAVPTAGVEARAPRKLTWLEERDMKRSERLTKIREARGSMTNAERMARGLSPNKPASLYSPTRRVLPRAS